MQQKEYGMQQEIKRNAARYNKECSKE